MKLKWLFVVTPLVFIGTVISVFSPSTEYPETRRTLQPIEGCVFMTTMGEQSSEGFEVFKNDENVQLAVRDGLQWLAQAQASNGGYGAGSHSAQHIKDPHAVTADPATTASVAMAFLRSGTTFNKGLYKENLKGAINYLLETVENTPTENPYINGPRGTQIQSKLGQNIDAVMTAQLLANLLDRNLKGIDKKRVNRCLDICVSKIEMGTDATGKQQGAGWAGVLQSGLATSALEAAQAVGANVDEEIVERSKKYQNSNVDDKGNVSVADGAGIVLYSVSSSVRSSAKAARKAKEEIEEAVKNGTLNEAVVTVENLQKAGLSEAEAANYATSYNVYNTAKQTAQRDDVMSGFGNNGGEEFLSFLQTGESMVVNGDDDWKQWYDAMSGRILKIQNADGSWNGHHCITSPVFCTSTSLLLLTVENDIEYLNTMGK